MKTIFVVVTLKKPTRWTSPETMHNGNPSLVSDVWSFGIVLWEIVTLGKYM